MKIKRRYPNFSSGFEETEHEVNSLEELKTIDWVVDMENLKGHIGFFYDPKDYDDQPDLLMVLAEGDNRPLHFAVGYIFGDGKELGLQNYMEYIKENK